MKPTGITDPDVAHDTMMDTAAESIDSCETFEDFWKIMAEADMEIEHAQQLWSDNVENQADKWAE